MEAFSQTLAYMNEVRMNDRVTMTMRQIATQITDLPIENIVFWEESSTSVVELTVVDFTTFRRPFRYYFMKSVEASQKRIIRII